MSFKEKLQERIERNTVKIPNVSWTDSDGSVHTEDVVLKRSKLAFVGDWSRIYPPINEDGSINWINTIFGGTKNFIKTLLILGILAMFLIGFKEVFNSYEALKALCDPLLIKINP